MPVYNRQDTILRSINSVLEQTYSNFEFIIVDDDSSDQTKDIIQSIEDHRIKYVPLQQNVGASAARNIGIDYANGRWIAFHDSDDLWEPSKLKKQVDLINDKSPSIIFTSFIRYRNGIQEHIPKPGMIIKENIHKELLRGNFIATPTVLLPKEVLSVTGSFNEKMPRLQDWELWLRISLYFPIIWIDEPLVKAFYTEKSISSDSGSLIESYEKIWDMHKKLFIDAGPVYAAHFLFSFGHNLSLYGDIKKGRAMIVSSLKYNFYSIKQIVCLFLNLSGGFMYKVAYRIFKKI